MPGNYINIDANFPTFTGRETSREQIQIMMNYIRSLVDQLRYTLNNLDAKNFNQNALDSIIEGGTENIAEQIQTLAAQLQQTNAAVSGLSGRVGNLEGLPARMTAAEDSISGIQQALGDQADAIAANAEAITLLSTALTQLLGGISVDTAGNTTIGGTGKRTDLNGSVYINNVPQ